MLFVYRLYTDVQLSLCCFICCILLSFYFFLNSVQRQKKVGKERVLTQLKDTLRKPLHSDPRRTNPLHSEEEVQAETVDTNVDLFDYPENFQPTVCHFRQYTKKKKTFGLCYSYSNVFLIIFFQVLQSGFFASRTLACKSFLFEIVFIVLNIGYLRCCWGKWRERGTAIICQWWSVESFERYSIKYLKWVVLRDAMWIIMS